VTLLEVCVDSLAGLARAEAGGAARIELCSRLDLGGLSPSDAELEAAVRATRLPLHVMVRPRAGDFVYDEREIAEMRREIERAKRARVAAVVFGLTRADGSIDVERTGELTRLARPLSVTFHRAFDAVPDQLAALEQLIELGIERVLTSGGAPNAHAGRLELRKLVDRSRGRIVVLAGGGVRAENFRDILRDAGVDELHSSTPFAC
jgi:copper homeostasis protein